MIAISSVKMDGCSNHVTPFTIKVPFPFPLPFLPVLVVEFLTLDVGCPVSDPVVVVLPSLDTCNPDELGVALPNKPGLIPPAVLPNTEVEDVEVIRDVDQSNDDMTVVSLLQLEEAQHVTTSQSLDVAIVEFSHEDAQLVTIKR